MIAAPSHNPALNKPRVTNASDFAIVKGMKERDSQVISNFYDKYSGLLFGMIQKELLCENISAVAFQNSFKLIVEDIESYDANKESLFIWAFKIVRKEVGRQKVNIVLRQLFSC